MARIDGLEDAGRMVGDQRVFSMVLTVDVAGGSPTRVAPRTVMVPLLEAHKLAVGGAVPVRYAAGSPETVTIDWDKV